MKKLRKCPYISIAILGAIVLGCILSQYIGVRDSNYMYLKEVNQPPSGVHLFGTDTLGRDMFAMIWHGGRVSIYIGVLATIITTSLAVVYGTINGLVNRTMDDSMMRFTELILSIPSILIVIFLQAIIGNATPTSIAIIIGLTSWMNIAKVVRSEVRQIRNSDYVLAARIMEGGFFYILWKHLLPNFISAIMFMVITNIGQAIGTEATLSFLGIGLPTNVISWGSLMSLSEKALLTNSWWIILIPGIFLVTMLICITNIGEYIRRRNNREYSNL